MKNVLVLTVGLPRSGKSTWSRKQRIPVVNPDSIRLAIHGQAYRQESEPMVWAVAHIMVESLFLAGHDRVILDATSGAKARRAEWKSDLWTRDYQVFDTPKEECIRRAKIERKNHLCPVIERMAANWEPIDEDDQDDPREVPDPS
jgi:predicted kinase